MKTFKNIKIGDVIYHVNNNYLENPPITKNIVKDIKESYGETYYFIFDDSPENSSFCDVSEQYINCYKYNDWVVDLEAYLEYINKQIDNLREEYNNKSHLFLVEQEYCEKYLKGLDETFDPNSPFAIGDKIMIKDAKGIYTILKINDDGSLYVGKTFKGIKHSTIRPEEFGQVKKVF